MALVSSSLLALFVLTHCLAGCAAQNVVNMWFKFCHQLPCTYLCLALCSNRAASAFFPLLCRSNRLTDKFDRGWKRFEVAIIYFWNANWQYSILIRHKKMPTRKRTKIPISYLMNLCTKWAKWSEKKNTTKKKNCLFLQLSGFGISSILSQKNRKFAIKMNYLLMCVMCVLASAHCLCLLMIFGRTNRKSKKWPPFSTKYTQINCTILDLVQIASPKKIFPRETHWCDWIKWILRFN